MSDLIRRQDAIDACIRVRELGAYDEIEEIKALPSAEPEIVRCRECKYSHLTYDGDCKECDKWLDDDDFHLTLYLDGDFYCGYAERRTDE